MGHLRRSIGRARRLAAACLAAWLASSAGASTRPDEESSTARYQLTYNWQKHDGFRAPYSGPYSLPARPEKMYTFSLTAHLGVRPWRGGEVYLNPELVQGVPFSGALVGLGGFTNGEITRAAGTNPSVYRQRLFLRQTWNHGGATLPVEADLNQMAGSVERNRFVLTAGNFSTLDVFDGNAYAKDPRTQFMNWSNWTYAAFDYAADARGFGWGFAAEWYREDWVLRVGRMSGPVRPNELPVDLALGKHYGDQVELEHAHVLAGRPGRVRVLAWRNRAVLARFTDALAAYRATPGADPQAILAVRGAERIKYGAGVNVEQALPGGAGFFLRAMQADGRTETHAFTEVDASLSTGVLLDGGAWGRAQDTAGVAFARNALSRERRRYLAAGGLSYFIGDGALRYRPETIVELFYSVGLADGVSVTFGYQRIANPAYNADRGPVDVGAIRVHAEF